MTSSLLTRSDWLLLIASVALLPWLYGSFWGSAGGMGEEVHIMVDGRELPPISLSKDQTLTIQGSIGPSVLEVANHGIRFISSPCQGKQCIHSGWHTHAGEFAACLPNRVALLITGRESRYDTFNY